MNDPGQPRSRFARCKPWLFAALAVAIVTCVLLSLRRAGSGVRDALADADPAFLLLALGLCILYRIVNSTGWVFVLRALGYPMPLAKGARIWIMAETMRWLPGSVWGFCSRVVQAGKAGAPPAVATASLPLELLLTIAAWAITAAAALCISGLAFNWMSLASPRALALAGGAIVLLGVVGFFTLVRLPRERLPGKVARLLDQFIALGGMRPQPSLLAFTLLHYTALCALNGVAFGCVLRALMCDAPGLTTCIGANACGWLAGFFAVGVPGGVGVREASSAMVLSTLVPVETVVAAALLWRLVLIADELCCLGVLVLPSLWKRGLERPGTASPMVADLRGPQP